jgi:thiamine biosynthesis lipoprotein
VTLAVACKAERPAPRLACASWSALGTTVVLRSADPRKLAEARRAAEAELAAVDRACSRFRADSELSRLNAHAGRPFKASRLFVEALTLALDAAQLTDGAVDPTVGRALELAGYDRDWSLLDAPRGEPRTPAITARRHSGWRTVELDPDARVVRIPTGVHLDLGASAKAWAADRAASSAHAASGDGVLVGVGGDIATAGRAPAGGWRVRVTDDHRNDASAPGQTVAIHSGGLATSSTTVRRWSHAGHTMHHLIDPASGSPVESCWQAVSVVAANCAQANIAATASIVRGEEALEWLRAHRLPARLQRHDGRVATIGGWPAQQRSVA